MRSDTRLLVQLCLGVWVCISNGAIFIFGIFSPQLRSSPFFLSQSEVNVIATIGAVASYVTLPVGLLYDKGGPRAVMLTGAMCSLFGWLGIAYVFSCVSLGGDRGHPITSSTSAVPTLLGDTTTTTAHPTNPPSAVTLDLGGWLSSIPPYYAVCAFYALSQLSSPFYEQGTVLTNLDAMSTHKGDVVLIQKTFMGLGSSIIAQVYSAYYLGDTTASQQSDGEGGDDVEGGGFYSSPQDRATVRDQHKMGGFCLFIALFSSIAGLVGGVFNRVPPPAPLPPVPNEEGSPATIAEGGGGGGGSDALGRIRGASTVGNGSAGDSIGAADAEAACDDDTASMAPSAIAAAAAAKAKEPPAPSVSDQLFGIRIPATVITAIPNDGSAMNVRASSAATGTTTTTATTMGAASGLTTAPSNTDGLNDNLKSSAADESVTGGVASLSASAGSAPPALLPPLKDRAAAVGWRAGLSRRIARLIATPQCPRVTGLNAEVAPATCTATVAASAKTRQNSGGGRGQGIIVSRAEASAAGGGGTSPASLSSPSSSLPASSTRIIAEEHAVAEALYGPFFTASRTLTLFIILLVTIITFVNTYWPNDGDIDAPKADHDWFILYQRIGVGIVLFLAAVGFSAIAVAFGPRQSFVQQATQWDSRYGDTVITADGAGEAPPSAVGGGGGSASPHHATIMSREDRLRMLSDEGSVGGAPRGAQTPPPATAAVAGSDGTMAEGSLKLPGAADAAKGATVIAAPHQQHVRPQQQQQQCCPIGELSQNHKPLAANMFRDPHFLFALLAFRSLVVMGVTTTVSANSSQMYYALAPDSYTDTSNAAMVSVFGVASALGRVSAGLIDRAMARAVAEAKKRREEEEAEASDRGLSTASPNYGSVAAVARPPAALNIHNSRGGGGAATPRADATSNRRRNSLTVSNSRPSSAAPPQQQQPTSSVAPPFTDSLAHDWWPSMFRLFRMGHYGRLAEEADDAARLSSSSPHSVTIDEASSAPSCGVFGTLANGALYLLTGPNAAVAGWNVLHVSLLPHIALLLAFPLFFVVPGQLLLLPFALVGFATGSLWGGLILAVSHLYGTRYIGGHYGALSFTGMVTPVLFNIVLFGKSYDAVLISRGQSLSDRCAGVECIVQPLLWCTGVNIAGTIACILVCRWASQRGGM